MTSEKRETEMTEQVKAEDALKGTGDQAIEASRAQRAFLAHMRHELRTPMNAIIGYSEMLLDDAEEKGQKHFIADLEKIHAAGKQVLTLVNDLLHPEEVEAGKIDLNPETFGANIRHELRTPLNAVIGYSEMLLEVAEDNNSQKDLIPDLKRIHGAGNQLLAFIDDIINLSKIEAGKMVPDLKTHDTSAMVQDVVTTIRPLEEDKAREAEHGSLLVVDDNETNRNLLSRLLKRQGYTVTVAENGRRALDLIEAQEFDLVLLDIMMPEMNGYQVLEYLKTDAHLRHIPVITISALDEIESVVRCIEMGAEDYLTKPFNSVLLRARIGACLEKKRLRDQEVSYRQQLERRMAEIQKLAKDLELRNNFIRETFGRYITDEVVASLLETPEGLKFGGENKRKVTILMSDLRGFTSLSEGLPPEKVVSILNIYLGTMTDVIMKHHGTIDEFIGDAILVIFGAPIWKADDAQRAVACAVEMQLAMEAVNEQNRREGLPEVEMGIGMNTGEVVVGNIGSPKRTKYGIVGSHVNLTARIESYTVGGQILISEATLEDAGAILRIDGQMQVEPKGVKEPLTLYEVGGIGGEYNLFLPERKDELFVLHEEIPLRYTVLEEKHVDRTVFKGCLVKLSAKGAEVRSENPVAPLSNIKMGFIDINGEGIAGDLYGKVTGTPMDSGTCFSVRFTAISPEVETFLQDVLASSSLATPH